MDNRKEKMQKVYLGDSVYANYDGYYVILTTENGYGASNTIAFEPEVLEQLADYLKNLLRIEIESNSYELLKEVGYVL